MTQIVTTFDGSRADRVDCKLIKGKYYEINRQCFKVEGQYHRINNGRIAYDHERSNWVVTSHNELIEGVADAENGKPIRGKFTRNSLNNVTLVYGKQFTGEICINESVAKACKGQESLGDGYFYVIDGYKGSKSSLTQMVSTKRTQSRDFYKFPVDYSSSTMMSAFKKAFKGYKPDFIPSRNIHNLLTGLSWGIEYETAKGTIPERHLFKNGLIACRDGSISGFEYVTIPLSGRIGLSAIFNQCELLQKYCEINEHCAVHIHIGGFPIAKDNILALYRALTMVQDELYSLFPALYRNTGTFKNRSYCEPLKNIGMSGGVDVAFNKAYEYLSGGQNFKGFTFEEHPQDRSGQHKWQVSPRYKIVNLISLLFGDRKTVEFRVHTPTMNPHKVINWLFITSAILKYVIQNKGVFLTSKAPKITLTDMITQVYKGDNIVVQNLTNYIKYRKTQFANENDQIGTEEIKLDSIMLPKNTIIT